MNYMTLICHTKAKDIKVRKVSKTRHLTVSFGKTFELELDYKQAWKIKQELIKYFGD